MPTSSVPKRSFSCCGAFTSSLKQSSLVVLISVDGTPTLESESCCSFSTNPVGHPAAGAAAAAGNAVAASINAAMAAIASSKTIRFMRTPFPRRARLVRPAVLRNEVKYEQIQDLAQLPRTRYRRSSQNTPSTRFGECSYLVFVYVHSFSAEQAPSFGKGPAQHTSAECILQGCEMLPYPGMPLGDMLDHHRMLQCQLIESPFVAVHLLGNVLSPERMHMLCGLLQIPEGDGLLLLE